MGGFIRHCASLIVAIGIAGSGVATATTASAAMMAEGADAKGTLVYKSRVGAFSAPLKYAWLVKAPNVQDPGKMLRRLYLSSRDIGTAIQECKTIMCADGQVTEGISVDFDAGRRLNYWIAMNGQKVQYSGTVELEAFAAAANDARHLAGRLVIDDVAAGGPKIDAEFNVRLLKEFGK
jgi:hypothetical protein